ncbi:response regulator transcription factor [Paenibacillus radicis (ex Gao et al. 2016)]|uniref:DNA-binding response regulator n=1 Tax=Paenibacillus radicis (ex Gao et al. 2016) TaxID=1737354 RepID=A0A917HLZ5_9BACL|nr:response regulator transcription factor [Paenibacillus radicis (ex Gao et al. 2016)]GGG83994.1 DNA-binding response regulator [Paenibacillus radicis (ex Gao et al. 2016)]
MSRRVLIVDDEREIAELIEIYLRNEGYETEIAFDGEQALEAYGKAAFDLVILDIMMPKMDGLEVCRRLRRDHAVPILMVSAKAEDMDKIMGLMTGADDYMIKPFNPLELIARVRSLIRRSYQYNPVTTVQSQERGGLVLGALTIDKASYTAAVEGRALSLTSTEFGILYLLASNPGRVYSAEEIFQQVWKEKYFESNNTVMVHISKLRDKLEQELGDKLIVTVWGVGYKIEG